MRCIETLSNAGGNAGRAAIKSNMRCIETQKRSEKWTK